MSNGIYRAPAILAGTYKQFVYEIDHHSRIRIPHAALFRAYNRRNFPEFWDCRIEPSELTECPLNLAVRLLTVQDDLEAAGALVDVWKMKHHASGVDVAIVIAEADRLTKGIREFCRKQKMKKMKQKQMDQKPKTRTRIIDEVRNQPGTPADIAFRLNLNRKTVGMQLQRLWKAGQIDRHESGIYSILGTPSVRPVPEAATGPRSEAVISLRQISGNKHIRDLYNRMCRFDNTIGTERFAEMLETDHIGIKGIEDFVEGLEQQNR